jgi:hypothetical protein
MASSWSSHLRSDRDNSEAKQFPTLSPKNAKSRNQMEYAQTTVNDGANLIKNVVPLPDILHASEITLNVFFVLPK